jgi:hypothetical protein
VDRDQVGILQISAGSHHFVYSQSKTLCAILLFTLLPAPLIEELLVRAALAQPQADQMYIDKNRYFSFIPPNRWTKTEFLNEPRSKVQFAVADAALVLITHRSMNPVPIATVRQNQENQLKVLEQRAGARTSSVRVIEFLGRDAVESVAEMQGQRLWTLHFYLPEEIFVTVTLSAYPRAFDARLVEAKASLATLSPLSDQATSPEEIRSQHIARLLNKAKIEVDLGRHGEAENAYQQVLQLDPGNATARSGLERLKTLKR